MPSLPLEIILLIIKAVQPENPDTLLPPHHETTKTLLNLTRVSKALYWPATQALRQHCAYLETRERAKTFCRCLQLSPPPFLKQQNTADLGLRSIETLFVACFPEDDGFVPAQEVITPELRDRVGVLEDVVDPELLDDPINYDAISDFSPPTSPDPSPVDDLATAMALYDIFHAIAPTLKRLVINMPLRTLWPEKDEKGIKKVLYRAFEVLINLEEFVSVQDELFLYWVTEKEWRFEVWPKLRRLSIYNPDLGHDLGTEGFLYSFKEMQYFEHFVCCRADGMDEGIERLKEIYGDTASNAPGVPSNVSRILTLAHVDVNDVGQVSWLDKTSLPRLRLFDKGIDLPPVPEFENNDPSTWTRSPADIVQEWVLQRSLEGTLWESCNSTKF